MSTIFPATYSTLCPVALAKYITDKYGFANTDCRLLVRGVGDTYLVNTLSDKYILRVYRSSHRNLPQIQAEVDLLLTLNKAGVPVSHPLTDKSGDAIQAVEAIEGIRHAVLFTYAHGTVVRQMSTTQLQVLGREMARMHQVSAGVNPAGTRCGFDFDTTLYQPLEMVKPNFADLAEDYQWLQETAGRAVNVLTNLSAGGFTSGYCHFDFLPKNFHFDSDAITFFDFDFMGYGWLVNDIATFHQHLCLDIYTGRATQEAASEAYDIFLEGYQQVRPLSEQEKAAVPYLGLGFWLFYMGFHTTHDQFFAFTQASHLKGIINYLRSFVATTWNIS
ncbi:phosphotransferase [Mucilaginibacter mali]|uniref:Phosphotransferase n=1 Tax=Mucilaginibacter mali TaxID=2740462 RepID=A0A7D4QIB1_9SPHI|nr:phosphotransferase [Mucilaginibacter mali]QKJ32692.1 phosphotransferase [Mucilaginibacter mali]